MSLASSVDAYCERLDPGFWAEPLNAITNVAFAFAAYLVWRLLRGLAHRQPVARSLRALPWALALVSVCSFLFHTLATVWAGLADQLSILLYGCIFLYAFLRHAAGLLWSIALAGALLFTGASYFTPAALPSGLLNQSGAYFPYLAGLTAITVFLYRAHRPGWRWFLAGTALFAVSLGLRTVDLLVCSAFPLGTHFLWHLLNAVVLFLLTRELAREALR